MSLQDPIADMLTRIRNAGAASLKKVEMPSSKMKVAIADVFKKEGYIKDYVVVENGAKKDLVIDLKYYNKVSVIEGVKRISKPSCRTYCGSAEIPKVRNGMGTVVLSTPQGIVSGKQAAQGNIGGEILCYIW
ncbi:MAG: 30S ribosomal protein S8 [Victivallaceae bacterium]